MHCFFRTFNIHDHWWKIHDDVDDDGGNGYERRPRSPDLSSSLFAAFFCHSHSREPPTFFSSQRIKLFSSKNATSGLSYPQRGEKDRNLECEEDCEEHAGIEWGSPRCPAWLRNNHWSFRSLESCVLHN